MSKDIFVKRTSEREKKELWKQPEVRLRKRSSGSGLLPTTENTTNKRNFRPKPQSKAWHEVKHHCEDNCVLRNQDVITEKKGVQKLYSIIVENVEGNTKGILRSLISITLFLEAYKHSSLSIFLLSSYIVTLGARGFFFKVGEKAQRFQINGRGRKKKSF